LVCPQQSLLTARLKGALMEYSAMAPGRQNPGLLPDGDRTAAGLYCMQVWAELFEHCEKHGCHARYGLGARSTSFKLKSWWAYRGRNAGPSSSRILQGGWRVAAIVLLFYAIPVWLEAHVALRAGPLAAYVLLGDLAGCLAIAFSNWQNALALYLILTTLEFGIFQSRVVSVSFLVWFSDFIPATLLSVVAATGDRHLLSRTPIAPQ
jgi:hypothetical protein